MPNARNQKYLSYVRSMSSCLWGEPEDWVFNGGCEHDQTVAHHCHIFGDGGIGTKPSDYKTVPLTASEHVELHNTGEKEFWRHAKVDPKRVIAWCLVNYIKEVEKANEVMLEYCWDGDISLLIQRCEWQIEEERGQTTLRLREP